MTVALPRFWRRLFFVELPLTLGTVIYWLLQPLDYLHRTLGPAASEQDVPLLMLYAGVVFTLVFWFYARLLLRPTVHLPTFRLYQEALLLGDAWIVAAGAWILTKGLGPPDTTGAAMAMASVWGVLRVIFLTRVRPRP
jgi:hypothetical protein